MEESFVTALADQRTVIYSLDDSEATSL